MANDHHITNTVKGQKRKAQIELPAVENKTPSSRSTRLQQRRERLSLPDAHDKKEHVKLSPGINNGSQSKRERLLPGTQKQPIEEQEMLSIHGQVPGDCERLSPRLDTQPPKSDRLSSNSDDESSKRQNERLSSSVDGQPTKKGHAKLSPNVEEQQPNKELGRLSPSVNKQPLKKDRGRLSPSVDKQQPGKEPDRLSPSVNQQMPKKDTGRLSPRVDDQLPKTVPSRLSPSVDEQLLKREPKTLPPNVDEQLSKTDPARLSPSVEEQCYEYERLSAGSHTDEILSPTGEEDSNESESAAQLTAAQRARMERNRLRARALQDARLVQRPPPSVGGGGVGHAADSGGGFLLEEEEEAWAEAAPAPAHAPVVDPALQPRCLLCERRFPQSYLFDTFDYSVCDDCRDDEGEHSLMTRTEAKNEYLLKDCDLDSRPPPLKCVRRRNPHRLARSDMRLYLRAQLRQRALLVWGSEAALHEERARRLRARDVTRRKLTARRLRALRMDVRSSLYDRSAVKHEHDFGPERHVDDDLYERTCNTCGHLESYEKM